MQLTFKCPHCKNTRLEEIMVNVSVASEIKAVSEDGDVEYGEQTNEDGEIAQYQCMSCGYILTDNDKRPITSCTELGEWLKQRKESK